LKIEIDHQNVILNILFLKFFQIMKQITERLPLKIVLFISEKKKDVKKNNNKRFQLFLHIQKRIVPMGKIN